MKEEIKMINNTLDFKIKIKAIKDIQTHDGLGEQLGVFIETKGINNHNWFFSMATDYYSCDLVKNSPFIVMTTTEWNELNKNNIDKTIMKNRNILNEDYKLCKGLKGSLLEIGNKLEQKINDDIEKLTLDISCGMKTTIKDVICTLQVA